MEDRRRVPRRSGSWSGFCRVEGESPKGGWNCQVIDISALGLAIVFHHPRPSDLVGRRISVDLPALGTSIKMTLEGEIRDTRTDSDGIVRAGIEFVDPSEDELYIIDLLTSASLGAR